MLTPEERINLIEYRKERAYKVLIEAEDNAKLGHWNLAGNRLYYAAFYMAQALLLDKGIEAHTHAGTIHLIGKNFIANGLLDKSYGRFFSRLFELRQSGDYDDMFDATEDEIEPFFPKVKDFLKDMEALMTFQSNTNNE